MINWQEINTVFLDMDGTLLDLRFDNHFWLEHVPMRYSERHSVSIEQAKQHLFPKMTQLKGKLDWYCTDFWTQELSLPIIELKREVAHLIKVRKHVKPFLGALRAAGKHVILFTNAHKDTVALKMEMTELTPAFDEVITSHSLGLAKENEGAWAKVATRLDFNPQQTLFIDDNFSVLASAERYGISHLLGIVQPDSSRDKLSHDRYDLLDSFEQIMPISKTTS